MTGGLRVEHPSPAVAVVVLDRPGRLNALDDDLLLEVLPATVARLAEDEEIRAVVFTGEGRAFCAGADLDCSGFAQPSATRSEAYMARSHLTPVRIRSMPQPTVAALKGPVIGAGLGLALACDFRFSAPDLRMGAPFVSMGLVPDFGVSYFLPRLLGPDRALDLLLTGRLLDAGEALSAGLITRVSDDVLGDSVAYAARLAEAPRSAVAMTRRNVYRSLELTLEAEVLEQEPRTQAVALAGSDFAERFVTWREQVQDRKSAP